MKTFALWVTGVLFVVFAGQATAESAQDLLTKGRIAYDSDNYLDAAKFFFALQQTTAYRGANGDLRRSIEAAQQYSEKEIRLAMDLEKSVRSHGPVTKMTIESHGSLIHGANAQVFTLPGPPSNTDERPDLEEVSLPDDGGGAEPKKSFDKGPTKTVKGASNSSGDNDKLEISRLEVENERLRSQLLQIAKIANQGASKSDAWSNPKTKP